MKSIVVAFSALLALVLGGCATDPILKKGEAAQIVDVNVTTVKGLGGTVNLPEAVRYKTQNAAYRYSEIGPEKILNVHITGVKIANLADTFMTGPHSAISAHVSLLDKVSGTNIRRFPSVAIIPRGGILGAIAAAGVDVVQEEQRLSGMLAENVMKRIYGEEHADSVYGHQSTKRVLPNYPVSYGEALKQLECKQIREVNELEKQEAAEKDLEPNPKTLPSHCNT